MNGDTYVAYLFAHHANDGSATGFGPDGDSPVISCGSYAGNGNDARTIDLGFEAQWLLVKRSDGATDWWIVDSMRGLHARQISGKYLEANTSNAEASQGNFFADSQGFMVDAGDYNSAGETYIYMAIRKGSLFPPEAGDATKVFNVGTVQNNTHRTLTNSLTGNLSPDFVLFKTTAESDWIAQTRLTGKNALQPHDTDAELTIYGANWGKVMHNVSADGTASTGTSSFGWMWARAPSYFDVVAYSGTGSARTVPHGLQKVPEMIWLKKRNGVQQWVVYHSAIGSSKYMHLDNTDGANSGTFVWNGTDPTSTHFSVTDIDAVNDSSGTYIAYLFATVAGVSKVGSYTADGNAQNIDCGFGGSGARFVLIKRTDTTGNWFVLDTARGIVAGNDPLLELNSTSAEDSGYDNIDPHSSGFTITAYGGTSPYLNISGATYIFYAIA